MKRILAISLLLLLLTACGGENSVPGDGAAANTHPPLSDGSLDTRCEVTDEISARLTESAYPIGTQLVIVTLENNADRPLMYGRSYGIQKFEAGSWQDMPTISNYTFTMEGLLLDPGKSVDIACSTWFLQQPQLSAGTYRLTGSTLSLLGSSGTPDETLPPWVLEFQVSAEAGDISAGDPAPTSTVPPGAGDFLLNVLPPEKGGTSLSLSLYNNSRGEAEILLIPTLQHKTEEGFWEPIPVDDGIGFCGTPCPLPLGDKSWSVDVASLWCNLYSGDYRLSYSVTDAEGNCFEVMGQFTLTEDICQRARTK